MNYEFRSEIAILLKYVLLIIFGVIAIKEAVAQDVVFEPKEVRIYFQSISYTTQQSIPSTVVIYDTYYHKIDSVKVPEEGLYLNLPMIDLIFRATATEINYKPKGEVFYTDELKDSIKIIIDPKGLSRCPISIRPIFFEQNSYVLNSTALAELRDRKKIFLLSDDSTHRFHVELHSNIDVSEKKYSAELLKNRARVIKDVLTQNNEMKVIMFFTNNEFRPIEKPKTKKEHAYNRCVNFKVGWSHWSEEELIIKE